MSLASAIGFYGKLGSAGDFVQRRLSPAFVSAWDAAFEPAVAASHAALGGGWHEAYHASPVWRFVLAPRVCGASAWAGVFGPGVDRVKRCFPMVIAAELPGNAAACATALTRTPWFDAAERVLANARAQAPSVDSFDVQVAGLLPAFDTPPEDLRALLDRLDWAGGAVLRLPLPGGGAFDGGYLGALWSRLPEGARCLWWTRGGGRVPASIHATIGLPRPDAYAAFIDAAQAGGWRTAGRFPAQAPSAPALTPPPAPPAARPASDELADLLAPVPVAAAAPPAPIDPDATRPGFAAAAVAATSVRPIAMPTLAAAASGEHEPVFHRADCALTVVAADAGGHDPGERAAAQVRRLAETIDAAALATSLSALAERLHGLHTRLRAAGEDLIDPLHADCAVVAARSAGRDFCVLRIGPAAAWRYRAGTLLPISVPATAAKLPGGDALDDLLFAAPATGVAGLGASGEPAFEECRCELLPGDRFLLAATPLLTGLAPELLARALAAGSAGEASRRIAAAAGLDSAPASWPFVVIEIES